MIYKEADKKQNLQKHQEYGEKAEKQMAFYLRRAFQNNKTVHVINDLRLQMNEDVAQIDHLIIHKYGFLIIESKSVTSKISINEFGEWIRNYPKFTRGMPSPVNQAKRQADFLKNYLAPRSEELLRKGILFKSSISHFKFDVLVAISDNGIIKRSKGIVIPEVLKADQIVDSVNSIIDEYAATNNSLITLKTNYQFLQSSSDKVIKYLLKSHTPTSPPPLNQESQVVNKDITTDDALPIKSHETLESSTNTKLKTNSANSKIICKKCSSVNLEITYGRYGYYFKCLDCNGNTSIKLSCMKDDCKPRIKKQKNHFFKTCESCNSSDLYFINK